MKVIGWILIALSVPVLALVALFAAKRWRDRPDEAELAAPPQPVPQMAAPMVSVDPGVANVVRDVSIGVQAVAGAISGIASAFAPAPQPWYGDSYGW